MLFHKIRTNHRARTRRVVNIGQPARLPAAIKTLDLLCRNHAAHDLPLRMVFIGESASLKGQPMAVYACPNCNCREGWVRDRFTGRPLRLWRRSPNAR